MNARCTNCRQPLTLSVEYMMEALAAAEKKNHKYHNAVCPNCRRNIRVSVALMRAEMPRDDEAVDSSEEAAASA